MIDGDAGGAWILAREGGLRSPTTFASNTRPTNLAEHAPRETNPARATTTTARRKDQERKTYPDAHGVRVRKGRKEKKEGKRKKKKTMDEME